MNDGTSALPHHLKVTIRVLVRALLYFVLCVFAVPCAWSTMSGSDVRPPIHSWMSWLVWGVVFLFASALQELIWQLLTRDRRAGTGR